jgi:hypothetical protein
MSYDSTTAAAVAAGWHAAAGAAMRAWSDMHGPPRDPPGSSMGMAASAVGGEYRPLVNGGDLDTHTSLEPP